MSIFKVEVVEIDSIQKHPNADRLSVCQVKGWNVITQLDAYKPKDICIYVPIDSILDIKLESFLFPPDSKITLEKSRVKTIKIRGAISQGMIIPLNDPWMLSQYPKLRKAKVGDDVKDILGISKYEPPAPPVFMRGSGQAKQGNHPDFHKYTDIENFKNYPDLFVPGEEVYITEKLHGTNMRAGNLSPAKDSWIRKILRFFRLISETELCYGSRNMQLQGKFNQKTYYSKNVYAFFAKTLLPKLQKGEIIYGEIVGDGIQKNYKYGCKQNEWKFFAFDVKKDGQYLDHDDFLKFCREREIEFVPLLYKGPFDIEKAKELTKGDSKIGGQKIREGVVIRPVKETNTIMGRKILKLISDEYLLKNNSDWH